MSNTPNPYGQVIAGLKPGQIIIIAQGYGFPKTENPTSAVIWMVDGMSALTTDGIGLSCHDGQGVTPAEAFDLAATPTWAARKVWYKAKFRSWWRTVTEARDNLQLSIWSTKYKIKRWWKNFQAKP